MFSCLREGGGYDLVVISLHNWQTQFGHRVFLLALIRSNSHSLNNGNAGSRKYFNTHSHVPSNLFLIILVVAPFALLQFHFMPILLT